MVTNFWTFLIEINFNFLVLLLERAKRKMAPKNNDDIVSKQRNIQEGVCSDFDNLRDPFDGLELTVRSFYVACYSICLILFFCY
jgi:hypothetical protein